MVFYGGHPVGNAYDGLHSPKDYIHNLESVIGRIPDHIKHDFVENQSITFEDLTELLLKRVSPVITRQVVGLLQKTYVSPYTSYLLPIRQLGPYESINVTWTEVSFNPGIAPQVETQGVGRYFTHNKTRRGARAVRRGLAIKIESGFFMTPEGRKSWVDQIEQVVTIVQNTNEYDVVLTLLQVPMRQERHANQMNGPNNRAYGAVRDMTFEQTLDLEKRMFGIVNKTEDSRGFINLITNLRTVMAKSGCIPDAIVVPPYLLGHYHTYNDDLWHYQSAGPDSKKHREMATDIGGTSAFRSESIQGMRVIDSHIYRAVPGSRYGVSDLLTAPFQIGEYYPLEIDCIYRELKSFDQYSGDHRNVRLFNEDQSRFVTVYFSDILKNSLRFDPENEGGDLRDLYDHVSNDIFVQEGGASVDVWGQIRPKYLDDRYLERTSKTLANLFSPSERNSLNKALWDYGRAVNGAGVFGTPEWTAFESDKVDEAAFNSAKALITNTLVPVFSDLVHQTNKPNYLNMVLAFLKGGRSTTRPANQTLINDSWQTNMCKFEGVLQNRKGIMLHKSILEKVLTYMFLITPINSITMSKMHDNDVFIPIDIILCRPSMTYNMSSIIMMKAGKETGETIIGNQDFAMSSNTQDKTMEGFYTYYGKSIVYNSRNVMIAPRVFNQGYVRGNNVKFVTDVGLEEIQQTSGLHETDESLIPLIVPCGGKILENNSWIDYRGKNNNTDKLFHESAEFYNSLFQINDAELAVPGEEFVDYEDQTFAMNSICWTGHFETGKGFGFVNQNAGHLGPNTYDQVNHSRMEGQFSRIKPLTFQTRIVN